MGIFHRHQYEAKRTERTDNGIFVKETRVVKCSCCGKEGVSHTETRLNPRFRDRVIDSQ